MTEMKFHFNFLILIGLVLIIRNSIERASRGKGADDKKISGSKYVTHLYVIRRHTQILIQTVVLSIRTRVNPRVYCAWNIVGVDRNVLNDKR